MLCGEVYLDIGVAVILIGCTPILIAGILIGGIRVYIVDRLGLGRLALFNKVYDKVAGLLLVYPPAVTALALRDSDSALSLPKVSYLSASSST